MERGPPPPGEDAGFRIGTNFVERERRPRCVSCLLLLVFMIPGYIIYTAHFRHSYLSEGVFR